MHASQIGTMNDEFTLSIDLAPTLLSAAGIAVPTQMQGKDIAQLYLKNHSNEEESRKMWRKDFFYEWKDWKNEAAKAYDDWKTGTSAEFDELIPPVSALIRKDYKYIYWPSRTGDGSYKQLFNIENDPYEEFDIFNSTAQVNSTILKELETRYAYLRDRSQNGHPV